jgi:light-regulated signal transduction histidine kinase (bacteriophytochrome)
MRQLQQNLRANALEFARVDVRPEISLHSASNDFEPVRLEVHDRGIGFDNRLRVRFFVAFQRQHARSSHEGLGIGLALVRRIVECHGGRIEADGREGEGACSRIVLPRRQAAAPDNTVVDPATATG